MTSTPSQFRQGLIEILTFADNDCTDVMTGGCYGINVGELTDQIEALHLKEVDEAYQRGWRNREILAETEANFGGKK